MGTIASGYAKTTASALFGVLVFLFWWLGYPHALSYQEQYQMFLFTNDYFTQRVTVRVLRAVLLPEMGRSLGAGCHVCAAAVAHMATDAVAGQQSVIVVLSAEFHSFAFAALADGR